MNCVGPSKVMGTDHFQVVVAIFATIDQCGQNPGTNFECKSYTAISSTVITVICSETFWVVLYNLYRRNFV